MKSMSDYSIETNRFILSLIQEKDADDVFAIMNDKATADIISFLKWPITMEQAEHWCQRSLKGFAHGNEFLYIARAKENHKPVGCISVHSTSEPQVAEVGYFVNKDYQGKGCATEMLKAIIHFALKLSKVSILRATAAFENVVSSHILTKEGFVLIGTKDLPTAKGTTLHCQLYEYKNSVA